MWKGDTTGAAENIQSVLRISKLLGQQRMIIAQVLAVAQISMAQKATWDLLQSDELGERDLQRLQEDWELVDVAKTIVPAIRFERAQLLPFFFSHDDEILGNVLGVSTGLPDSWNEVKQSTQYYLWEIFFRSSDQRQLIKEIQNVIESAPDSPRDGPWNNTLDTASNQVKKLIIKDPSRFLSLIFLENITIAMPTAVAAQAQASLTFTAVALRRYQIGHGSFPTALADLIPVYLPKVPVDPVNGLPLRYKLNPSGDFTLYSVGIDGRDDGGVISNSSPTKSKDILWPLPVPPITPAPAGSGPETPRE